MGSAGAAAFRAGWWQAADVRSAPEPTSNPGWGARVPERLPNIGPSRP